MSTSKRRVVVIVMAAATILPIASPAGAAAPKGAGDLDPTFGRDGKVTTNFGPDEEVRAIAIDRGNVVVAGCTGGPRHNDPNSLALARYRSNGALDPSFGDQGKVTTDLSRKGGDCALDVAIQRDGKIVVAGSSGFGRAHSRFAIVRYNPDGRLDSTFGGDGRVTTDFTPDSDWATAVAIQADGKIVAAGQSGEDFAGSNTMFAVVRYNPDGSRDATFGERGRVTTDFTPGDDLAQGIALQADGKIVVAGFSRGGFALARYEADGTPDATFGANGTVTDPGTAGPGDAASDVEILLDGKILIAGSNGTGGCKSCGSDMSTSFALMRFNVDGTIDTTFGDQGLVLTAVSAKDDAVSDLAVQRDGRIVVAGVSRQRRGGGGDSRFALARYDAEGSLDPTFGGGGVITTNFSPSWDFATGMAIQLNGRSVAAGITDYLGTHQRFALARYLSK